MISNDNAENHWQVNNIHALARRYCMDQAQHWRETYGTMPQRPLFGDYSEEEYRTFPRYNVLDAILEGVEVIVPDEFTDIESLRARLLDAAATDNLMTRSPGNNIVRETMNEERAKFARYIESIGESDLYEVEPLHYRRKLRAEEAATVSNVLKQRWKANLSCWYPLDDKPEGVDVEAFHVAIFAREVGYERLYEILARYGVKRVFEIREGGVDGHEVDVAGSEPEYGHASKGFGELWWTDKDASFLIYASHESSITLGGWLLNDVRAAWPSWQAQIYTGWDQA